MNRIISTFVFTFFAIGAFGQTGPLDTLFVLQAKYQSFFSIDDTTYSGIALIGNDQLGQGYHGLMVNVGDVAGDQQGRLYRIDSILQASRNKIVFECVELQSSVSGPFGKGWIMRASEDGLFPQLPQNSDGFTEALATRIANNNIARQRTINTFLESTNAGLDKLSFTDVDVDSSIFTNTQKSLDINLNVTSTLATNKYVRLPKASNTDSLLIGISTKSAKTDNYHYYVEPYDSTDLLFEGLPIRRYYIAGSENIKLESKDGKWKLYTDKKQPIGFNQKYYNLGDRIGSYIVEGAPPATEFTNDILSYNQYPFIIPVLQKSPPAKKNLLRASEDMYPNGGAGVWLGVFSSSTTITQNDAPGPFSFGRNTAERWQLNATTGTVYGRTNEEPTVGSYTLSGWIKVGPESYNDNVSMTWRWTNVPNTITQDGPVSLNIDASNKEWQYFEATVNVTASIPGSDNRIRIDILDDTGDYVWVERWKLEKNPIASEYDKTGPEDELGPIDTAFAVYYPIGGILNIDDINWDTIPDHRKITLANQFCSETNLCHTVRLNSNLNTDSTAYVYEYMTLDLNGYTINYSGNDSTLNVVELIQSDASAYVIDQTIKNGVISTTDTVNALLKFGENLRLKIENVRFDGNNVARFGITDDLDGLGSLFTNMDGLTIDRCDRGIYLQRAHYTFIKNFQILSGGYGIYNEGGSMSIRDGSIENNDSTYLYWDADANFLMEHVYTEDSPSSSPAYRFDFQQGHNISIKNSSFNGGEGTPDFAINVANVRKFQVKETKFNSGSCDEILKTDDVTKWAVIDCNSNVERLIDNLCWSQNVNHSNGYVKANGRDICGNTEERINTQNSNIERSKIGNTTLQDTIFTQNLILAGSEGNLLKWSDSLNALVAAKFTVISNYDLRPNGIIGVSADSTAELFIQTTASASTDSYMARNTLKPLEAGKTYGISMYVKKFSTATGNPRFSFRAGGTADQQTPEFTDTCLGQYVRFYSYIIPETTTSTLTIRFGGGDTGDSIVVANMVLNEGYFPLSHTLGGENYQIPNPGFSIPTGKKLEIIGDVDVSGLLTGKKIKGYQYAKDTTTTQASPLTHVGGDTTLMRLDLFTVLRQNLPEGVDSFLNRSDTIYQPDILDGEYILRVNFNVRTSTADTYGIWATDIGSSLAGTTFIDERSIRFPKGINVWNPVSFAYPVFASDAAITNGYRFWIYGPSDMDIEGLQIYFSKFSDPRE